MLKARLKPHGGIHPDSHKQLTSDKPIKTLDTPWRLLLPLKQHAGAPALPVVSVGEQVLANQLLAKGDTCDYLYDFGDGWLHRITVEDIRDVKPTPSDGGFAWVDAGERACPPDDAGGPGGYQEFLDLLDNAPYGEETKAFREWAGLDFDPQRFDRQAVNAAIARMLWNGWIKIGP